MKHYFDLLNHWTFLEPTVVKNCINIHQKYMKPTRIVIHLSLTYSECNVLDALRMLYTEWGVHHVIWAPISTWLDSNKWSHINIIVINYEHDSGCCVAAKRDLYFMKETSGHHKPRVKGGSSHGQHINITSVYNRTLQTPSTAPLIIIIQPQRGKQEKALQRLQQDNTYSCIVGKKEGADEIQSHSGW